MKWRLGYRTIVRTSELPMDGQPPNGPGYFNFDRWEDKYKAAFQLMVAFSFWAPSTPTDCTLIFLDPDAANREPAIAPRMVILDTALSGIGPLQSFYEDNLGQGFALPWRERTGLPYDVRFDASGEGEGGCVFQLMMWWEPKFPSVQVWEMLCALPGLVAGMERSTRDTVEAQVAAGDDLFAVLRRCLRQGKLPDELRKFVADMDAEG